MKKSLLFIMAMTLISCGKSSNQVSSQSTETQGNNTIETSPAVVDFSGVYDLVDANPTPNSRCGASIRIISECNGYKILSNNQIGAEEFCNINTSNPVDPGRVPPPPDRAPPPPDRRPPVILQKPIVTQNGNELKSSLSVSPTYTFTNTLTLNQRTLVKVSLLKSSSSRCVFEKR